MAIAIKKKSKSKKNKLTYSTIMNNIKNVFFSSQGLPIFLILAMVGILFILFRMKGIEINYKISSTNKDIERVLVENKEYKAKRARLLSIKNLNKIADKYKLAQPREKQIIVIP